MQAVKLERPFFCTCLYMGLLIAALWAAPLSIVRFILFTENQYQTAFIAVCCWCIAINGVTLILNFLDKSLACCDCGSRRVPEAVLHFFTLLGGGASTVLAMIFLRHKFKKGSYHRSFLVVASYSFLFIGGAYALAYGLEWYMSKDVLLTTPATINNTSFSTFTTNVTAHQSTPIEEIATPTLTTMSTNYTGTLTTAFDSFASGAISSASQQPATARSAQSFGANTVVGPSP